MKDRVVNFEVAKKLPKKEGWETAETFKWMLLNPRAASGRKWLDIPSVKEQQTIPRLYYGNIHTCSSNSHYNFTPAPILEEALELLPDMVDDIYVLSISKSQIQYSKNTCLKNIFTICEKRNLATAAALMYMWLVDKKFMEAE